ncbi:hypothetical protein MKC55_21000 [[Clostridium] innocuum]|nr:hypothetical protein [[Clostridium] innocuum]
MKLTVEQANVLDKIAEKSGMDCWFAISDDLTCIHDIEAKRNISLRYGIGILNQGTTDLIKDYGLTEHEVKVYHDLLISLGLEKEQGKDMVKDDLGINGKYTIINKVVTGTGFNVVLGMNESHPIEEYRYVTWTQNNRGYDVGHYFSNLKEAQADMLERASNEMNIDLHEKWYNEFMENDIVCALSEFLSDTEVEELKNNKEFMAQAVRLYQKADVGVDQAIKDGVTELYEDFKDVTVVEFDEDLDEIEME